MNADKLSFLGELIARFRSANPEFFKKYQKVFGTIAAILGMVWGAIKLGFFATVIKPEWMPIITTVVELLAMFFTGATFTSFAPTTKAELQDETTKENVVKSLNQVEIHDIKTK